MSLKVELAAGIPLQTPHSMHHTKFTPSGLSGLAHEPDIIKESNTYHYGAKIMALLGRFFLKKYMYMPDIPRCFTPIVLVKPGPLYNSLIIIVYTHIGVSLIHLT